MNAVIVPGSSAVTLRYCGGELVGGDGDLRPGDKVRVYQANDVPIIVMYERDDLTADQVKELAGLESDVTEMALADLPGLPLTNLTVFGVGSFLETNPELIDQFGVGALENLAHLYEVMPWYMGYLLSIIRDKWEDTGLMDQDGLWRRFSGESFDGLAGRITKKAYKTYMQWIECASLYMRNSEGLDWLRTVTVDYIMREVKIGNAWKAASSVRDGTITVEAIAALLGGKPGSDVKHELARRDNGTSPDSVTPDVISKAIEVGEYHPSDEDVSDADGESADDKGLEKDEWVQHGSPIPQWYYDKDTIGYWLDGMFTPAMRVVDDSLHTSGMIVQMLSKLPIKPSRLRDVDDGPSVVAQPLFTELDSDAIVAWYYEMLEGEPSTGVRKQLIKESGIPVARMTQAVRHHVKCLMLESFDNKCPVDGSVATDLHEVILLRNDAPPITMLAVNAFNPHNCILVSRATNRKGENPSVRGALIKEMERREYDPIAWGEGLRDSGQLKGFHMPKIKGHLHYDEDTYD